MVDVLHLYLDDSGTRDLNRKPARKPAHGRDWFSLGGILVRQEDEPAARQHHLDFMTKWELDPDVAYLHSAEIRGKNENFTWLAGLDQVRHAEFMSDLYALMNQACFLGIACVIDRPGYERRYRELYGRGQWSLCKTAFSVVVERAVKLARRENRKLKVFCERADQNVDGWMKGYYEHLRTNGMPFDAGRMSGYNPLTADQMRETLYEFRTKQKSSPMMQIADLYLWPMSIGGYHQSNRTYANLKADNRLIDCILDPDTIATEGIKYSCWENVAITL